MYDLRRFKTGVNLKTTDMDFLLSNVLKKAGVAELVDAPDLGSGAARRGGSSPSIRTKRASGARDEKFIPS